MIHLELRPEIEAQLAAEAQARGLALGRYLEEIITETAEEETRLNKALQQGFARSLQAIRTPPRGFR